MLEKYLDWTQRAVWAYLLLLCFQGKGSHAVFLLAALALPLIRCVVSRRYRARLKSAVRGNWQQVKAFSVKTTAPLPWKPALYFAALPAAALCLANGVNISSMDNYPTSLTASSLVLEGNTELSEYTASPGDPGKICTGQIPNPYYLRCARGGIYSAYTPGMLAIALPFTVVSRLVGGQIADGRVHWRLAKWASACTAAAAAAIFFLLLLHLVGPQAALACTWLLLSGSVLLSIVGQGLWSQSGVLLGFLIVLLAEAHDSARMRKWRPFIQAAAIAWMLSCRLSAALLILPFGVWLLYKHPKRALVVTTLSLLFLVPCLIYFQSVYGYALGPQMLMAKQIGFTSSLWEGLEGTLVSPSAGLLVYQPWIWLALAALLPAVRRKMKRLPSLYWFLVPGIIAHVITVSLWPGWWGGIWGSRHLSEIVPLVMILVAPVIEVLLKSKSGRRAVLAMGILSFVIQGMGVYCRGDKWFYATPVKHYARDEDRMLDWSDPPFLYPILSRLRR